MYSVKGKKRTAHLPARLAVKGLVGER